MPSDENSEIQNININQSLYPGAGAELLAGAYGTKITDAETGQRKDTGAQVLAEEVARILTGGKLVFTQPIVFHARTNGEPLMRIIYENGTPGQNGQPGAAGEAGLPGATGEPGQPGPSGPSAAIEITNAQTGEMAQLGIGLQNLGLVANEFVPLPFFFLNPETVNSQLTNTGGGTGPSGATGYNPPQQGGAGQTGGRSGLSYGALVGQGTGWQPLYQQATPGVPPSSPNSGTTFPFVTGPMGWGFWYQQYGKPSPPGPSTPPSMTTGVTQDLEVVVDVEWDETTCEMTKTTKTLVIEDGLIKEIND